MQDEQTQTTEAPTPETPANPPTTAPAQPPTAQPETPTRPPQPDPARQDFYALLDEFRGIMPFQFVAKYEQCVDKHHPKA